MRCIIVDDEPLALNIMKSYCEDIGYLEVIGTFTNPFDATGLLMEQKVDLVFSDIEMPQINGLEFIKTLDRKPLFVFTTAYQKYALDGFDLNAVDYLVKPIPFERFVKAVNRAKEMYTLKQAAKGPTENITSAGGDLPIKDGFIFIKSEYGNIKLEFDDIKYIQGLKDYLKIHSKGNSNKPILTLMSFRVMEAKLPSNQFFRVHRSFMVNINYIDAVQRSKIIIDDIRIPIGDSYKANFMKRVGL
ncbi:response regulator transcription factor [Flavobacteriaceae bacterium TP-CH-4]|uniref:Response regulator transcription factor n=1 Tax=Pelagihabitans pacificus TaxID=2696054 RepID=A0A967E6G7_9FLAO|nr:response regulator transcription factor [Pelagihabitans pacificus]NHF59580.1 response regulator transcription factor [Pelagihabitans pacificus]